MRGCNSGTRGAEVYLVHGEAAAVGDVGDYRNASRTNDVSSRELKGNRRFGSVHCIYTGRLSSPSLS
jgi:hypothetical protein